LFKAFSKISKKIKIGERDIQNMRTDLGELSLCPSLSL
jgi:hypothetical protein